MNIQGIKLVTGEELVVKIEFADSPGAITIKDPLVLVMGQDRGGGILLNFMPWTVIAEGPISLESGSVIARYPVSKQIQDNYLQAVTGLQIVPATSQILKG